MFTSSVFFMGRFRPAYWQRPTLAGAIQAARSASYGMNKEDGDKLRAWMDATYLNMQRNSSYASLSSSHGMLGFSLAARPHDSFLDRSTADMPHCPGLDYSECCNLTDAEQLLLSET